MLKTGICLIGFSYGVAIFIPRQGWGLFTVIFLLITGMIFVIVSPRLRTEDDDTAASLPGPEGTIRRSEPGVRPTAIRGRHAKEEAALEHTNISPLEPGD